MRADPDARLILEIEIDRRADPLAGVVRLGPRSPGESFVGWMGLTRAIEMALERRRTDDGPPAATQTTHTTDGRRP